MKQRFFTSIFIVLATIIAAFSKLLPYTIGDYIFDIFILIIAIVASIEVTNIMEQSKKKLNKLMVSMYAVVNYVVLITSYKFVKLYELVLIQIVCLVAYWLISFMIEYFKNTKVPVKQHLVTSFNTLLACVYPTFFLLLLLNVNHADEFHAGVKYFSLLFIITVFVITYLTDTFADLVGCSVKGPKLAPKISPKKTISGAVGGLLGGMIGTLILYFIAGAIPDLAAVLHMYDLSWWHFLIIGGVGSILGQMGDLFESKLKRNAGIKDSGDIFPGHGGMLDRYDALIFVSAFIYLVIFIILL